MPPALWFNLTMGQRWTDIEDRAVIAYWRNWPALCAVLPDRTRDAIDCRGSKIGLRVPKRAQHQWTRTEERQLLIDWEERDWVILRTKYPWNTPAALRRRVHRLRAAGQVAGPRRPFARTGEPALDAILAEAFRRGLSLRDIDRMAGTKTYFRTHQGKGHSDLALTKALTALGGSLWVEWPNG